MRIYLLLMTIVLTTTSCVLPVPHKRLHGPGVTGIVIDADRETPIVGATVSPTDDDRAIAITDGKGFFSIPPRYGWHGAAVVFPPGPSLFPSLDVPSYERKVVLRAKSYQEQDLTVSARNPGDEWTQFATIKLKRNP
jgi:hypothetical protein